MIVRIVEVGLFILAVYLAAGLVAVVALQAVGLRRIDPAVKGAGLLFRVLITPGLLTLWPLMLRRWLLSSRVAGPEAGSRAPTPERLRRRHARLVQLLAMTTPLLFAAALATRPAPPAAEASMALRDLGQPSALDAVLAELESPLDALPLDARVRGSGVRRQLELIVREDLEPPSIAAYWSPLASPSSPRGASFLGIVWGPAERRYALPDEASAGGSVLLHSIAHAETLGSFPLPPTPTPGER